MWALTSLSLGIDSLILGAVVVPFITGAKARWLLAALFGLCDGVASVIHSLTDLQVAWVHPDVLPSVFAICYAGYVSVLALWAKRTPVAWPLWLLPVLASLDNLLESPTRQVAAPLGLVWAYLGVTSGLMAATGMSVGLLYAARPGPRAAIVATSGLIVGSV